MFLITSALVIVREVKGNHELIPSQAFFGFVLFAKHLSHKKIEENSSVHPITTPLPVSPIQARIPK